MTYNRIITALILLLILIPIVFFASIKIFSILLLPALTIAAYEWARLLKYSPRCAKFYSVAVTIAVVGILLTPINAYLAILFLASSLFWIVYVPYSLYRGASILPIWEKRFLLLMGVLILCACYLALVSARQYNAIYLVSILAIIWLADTGAYFAGRAWGRHKLAPYISPGKTIEGAIGGLVLALLITIGLNHILTPTFFGMLLNQQGWLYAIVTVILLVGAGIIGDLFESLLKRQANVKDSGQCLPGHGGILDRIDALLPALPLAALLNHL